MWISRKNIVRMGNVKVYQCVRQEQSFRAILAIWSRGIYFYFSLLSTLLNAGRIPYMYRTIAIINTRCFFFVVRKWYVKTTLSQQFQEIHSKQNPHNWRYKFSLLNTNLTGLIQILLLYSVSNSPNVIHQIYRCYGFFIMLVKLQLYPLCYCVVMQLAF